MRRKRVPVFMLLLGLSGCMSAGSNYDEAKVTQITKEQTTESDLIAMFGEPNQRGINADGLVTLQWAYSEFRTNAMTFVPIAGSFLGGSDNKTKYLFVTLNTDGTVQSFHSSAGGTDTRFHTQSNTATTNG